MTIDNNIDKDCGVERDEKEFNLLMTNYGFLRAHQYLLSDTIRVKTYHNAISKCPERFKDKVVIDIGAGSGMQSFCALQAGAKRVYAIEPSGFAKYTERLAKQNGFGDRLVVINKRIEDADADIPEKADTIVSECWGRGLFPERIVESYLYGRKFLKPDGKMFPSLVEMHVAPFTDAMKFKDKEDKIKFWSQKNFEGFLDLSSMLPEAVEEYASEPIADVIKPDQLCAKSWKWSIDLMKATQKDLGTIEAKLDFKIAKDCTVHGLVSWFEVGFVGDNTTYWLSTSPWTPLTHWIQALLFIRKPFECKKGDRMTGNAIATTDANLLQKIIFELELNGRKEKVLVNQHLARETHSGILNDPFRELTGTESPTDQEMKKMFPTSS